MPLRSHAHTVCALVSALVFAGASAAPLDSPRHPKMVEEGVEVVHTPAELAQVTIYFAFDSAVLDPPSRRILREHAQHLVNHPPLRILLAGHADERGSQEYNKKLGMRRAESVRDLLVNHGVERSRIYLTSYGNSRPAINAETEYAYSYNRRVQLIYVIPK